MTVDKGQEYIAIGIDGHQYGLGNHGDLVAAAEAAYTYIDDDIVSIHVVTED